MIYAEENTRKKGLIYAEIGPTCTEVNMGRNGMKNYRFEKDTGTTLLQAINQEGWSVDDFIVEIQGADGRSEMFRDEASSGGDERPEQRDESLSRSIHKHQCRGT